MQVVKDLAVSLVEMRVAKGQVVSLVEVREAKDLAVLEGEMLAVKDLAVSLVEILVVKDQVVLDQETHHLVMVMMVLMKAVIFLLYLGNQELTIQYYRKYLKLHLLVTKDYQDTTLILKLDVKYFIYVLIILSMILYARMGQYFINNTSYVFGGINLIAQLPKVYMA